MVMSNHMIIKAVGYLGSMLVLISFLMSSVVKLRVINSIGGFIFALYAVVIQSYPTALMNFCLVAINIYYLIRVKKTNRHYDLIKGNIEEPFLKYLLMHYKNDIEVYFPGLNIDRYWINTAMVVCCDAIPAGVLLGRKNAEGVLEIIVDYSTPTYRDCSVGKYLYDKLSAEGIRKLKFCGNYEKHETYLQKMGFIKDNGIYSKCLEHRL